MKLSKIVAFAENNAAVLANAESVKREINSIATHIIDAEANNKVEWEVKTGDTYITIKDDGDKYESIWTMTVIDYDKLQLTVEVSHEELAMLLAHLDRATLELMMAAWKVKYAAPCGFPVEIETDLAEYPTYVGRDSEGYYVAMNRFGYADRLVQEMLDRQNSEYFSSLDRKFEDELDDLRV